jgi:hypothetical protein
MGCSPSPSPDWFPPYPIPFRPHRLLHVYTSSPSPSLADPHPLFAVGRCIDLSRRSGISPHVSRSFHNPILHPEYHTLVPLSFPPFQYQTLSSHRSSGYFISEHSTSHCTTRFITSHFISLHHNLTPSHLSPSHLPKLEASRGRPTVYT